VWPMPVEPSTLIVARHAVAISSAGTLAPGLLTDSQHSSFAQALAELASVSLPPSTRFMPRGVRVVVDDQWTRLFGETWPAAISDVRLFRRFVAARFAQRFETSADDWQIVTPRAWPGRPALCMAMARDLVGQLQQALAARACKPVRLVPLSVAEFEAAVPRTPRGSLIFVGSVAPRRMALLVRSARLIDAVLLPDCERIDLLAQAVFSARHRLVEGEQTTVLTETSRVRSTALLLSGHALPVTTRLPGTTLDGRDLTPAAAASPLAQAAI
jgi:hypothetical protein